MLEEFEFETMATPDPVELLKFYDRQHHETTRSRQKLERMISQTFCLVTARRNGELIGLARGVTDGVRGRMAECKLDPAFQGPACITKTDGRVEHDSGGIAAEMARRLIDAFHEYGVERIDVLAYETEVDFCEELGFHKTPGVVPMELCAGQPVAARQVVSAGATR